MENMELFSCCFTSFSSDVFTDISDSLALIWFRFLQRADIRCEVSEKLLIMRLQVNFIFFIFICFDSDPFWGIDIHLMRKSKCELDLSRSLHIELISYSYDFEGFRISF